MNQFLFFLIGMFFEQAVHLTFFNLFSFFNKLVQIFPSKPAAKAKIEPKITEEQITPDENQNSVRRRR